MAERSSTAGQWVLLAAILAVPIGLLVYFNRGEPLQKLDDKAEAVAPVSIKELEARRHPPRDTYEEQKHEPAKKTGTPHTLALPDGTFVAPLNGVVSPAQFKWTKGPYAPIVGKRRGKEPGSWWWYVHADGTMSTTAMVMREDLGRTDAVTIVAHPEATAPIRSDIDNVDGGGGSPKKGQ